MNNEWVIQNEKELDEEEISYLKQHGAFELVRCKDCKRYKQNTLYPGTSLITNFCELNGIAGKQPDWFCADGVYKEDR